jgi:hypothetical protein
MLTHSPSIVAASAKVLKELATLDMQVTLPPAASRAARSANSKRRRASAPAIDPRYLSQEPDRRAIIGGL